MHCIPPKFPISLVASREELIFYYAFTSDQVLSVPSSISKISLGPTLYLKDCFIQDILF